MPCTKAFGNVEAENKEGEWICGAIHLTTVLYLFSIEVNIPVPSPGSICFLISDRDTSYYFFNHSSSLSIKTMVTYFSVFSPVNF